MTITRETLLKFCLHDESTARPYLCVPNTVGEYTYATNGDILVRVPRIEGCDPDGRLPDFERAIPDFDKRVYEPLIVPPEPEKVTNSVTTLSPTPTRR